MDIVLDNVVEVASKMPGWHRSLATTRGGPVVVGAGWLGTKVAEYLNAKIYPHHDAGNLSELERYLDMQRPDVVLNFVGKTGRPNIDWCEDHKEETFYSNVTVPLIMYNECLKRNIRFVHISSGCIFNGRKPSGRGFDEEDIPEPVSYYGETKVRAEEDLIMMSDRKEMLLIPRIRMPIDSIPHERNLITKLAGYKKVISALNSVTVVQDFLHALGMLVLQNKHGIYHITNPGAIDVAFIKSLYKKLVDKNDDFKIIKPEELKTKAKRSNCLLDSSKLENEGIIMRDAEKMIRSCMIIYGSHKERVEIDAN